MEVAVICKYHTPFYKRNLRPQILVYAGDPGTNPLTGTKGGLYVFGGGYGRVEK